MHTLLTSITFNLTKFAAGCTGGGTVDIPVTTKDGQSATNSFETCTPKIAATSSEAAMVVRLIFGVIGAIAIIYIMYGAFRFVRSQGEPKEISQAKQTILYAIIGLVIAVSAEVIVSFAIGRL